MTNNMNDAIDLLALRSLHPIISRYANSNPDRATELLYDRMTDMIADPDIADAELRDICIRLNAMPAPSLIPSLRAAASDTIESIRA